MTPCISSDEAECSVGAADRSNQQYSCQIAAPVLSNDNIQLLSHPKALNNGGTVFRPLHFYSPPAGNEKPFFRVTEPTGVGYKNYECSTKYVYIQDLRAYPSLPPFRLSIHGFQLLRSVPPPAGVDLLVDESIHKHYYTHAKSIVFAHVPRATKVVIFDHTIRRASALQKLNRPVRKVHIDQTPHAALLRAKKHLDRQDAESVLAGNLRLRIINVWRPLKGPVNDHPLCVAESGSVEDEDLVEVDHQYDDRKGQTYATRYNAGQKFWYLSGMETSDAFLI
jgi:hypothetical protein